MQKIRLYCRSKLLSRLHCWSGTVYPGTLLPQCSHVFHISLEPPKDFYLPITLTKAPTAPSDCSYVPKIALVSQYPIFPALALTFTTLPFSCHTCYLFDWAKGGTGHGWFRTWVLTAMLADRTGKIMTKLKLCLYLLSHNEFFITFLGTYHLWNFYFRWIWLKFRIYWWNCRDWWAMRKPHIHRKLPVSISLLDLTLILDKWSFTCFFL